MKPIKIDREALKKCFIGLDRKALADALETSPNVMNQIAGGFKRVSAARARAIERSSKGQVPAAVLRPDIFD